MHSMAFDSSGSDRGLLICALMRQKMVPLFYLFQIFGDLNFNCVFCIPASFIVKDD